MASKAVRVALANFQRDPMLESDEIPLQTILWRILVQPLPPRKKNAGGMIVMPKSTQDAEEYKTSIGQVIQLGHFAFKSVTQAGLSLADEPYKPKAGDFVLHETYAGQIIDLRNGKKLRLLLDTEVLAVVTDPEDIRNYI